MEAGLYQRQVAGRIGVTVCTVLNWEKDRTKPPARHWPRIIDFLGYDPYPEPVTFGERLQGAYRIVGLSRKEVAQRLGIDENSLKAYEDGASVPQARNQAKLDRFLKGGAGDLMRDEH